jgi:UDP-N-acetyl-D-glucosamine dehydrogenase
VLEVIEAAATKPFGFMPFYPGPGVGGHCIPCDPQYLLWQLRRERTVAPVIESAMSAVEDPGRHRWDLVLVHTVHPTADLRWLASAPSVLDTTYRLGALARRTVL